MLLDTDDQGISVDLYRDGTREWNCPEIMKSILKPGMVCIEAGACIGFYALMEAKAGCKVYAIEPNPSNVNILNQAVTLNGYENIEVFNIALGNVDRTNDFMIEARANLGRILHTQARDIPAHAIVDVVQVEEKRLDTFTVEQGINHVDLLRFDIESYEVELIEGAQKTLHRMPKGSWIFGEFHTIHFENPKVLQPAIESLIEHGFVPRHVIHMLNASGSPVPGIEDKDPKDFARACVEDFPKSAPRVFMQKV